MTVGGPSEVSISMCSRCLRCFLFVFVAPNISSSSASFVARHQLRCYLILQALASSFNYFPISVVVEIVNHVIIHVAISIFITSFKSMMVTMTSTRRLLAVFSCLIPSALVDSLSRPHFGCSKSERNVSQLILNLSCF